MVSYGSNCTCNKMTSLAVVSSALLSRHVHWAAAALIVLGLVAYLVVIGCTSKHVLIPSFITLTPNPYNLINQLLNKVKLDSVMVKYCKKAVIKITFQPYQC